METRQAKAISISRRNFTSLISQLTGGYPNPDDPQPPGPWDPVIRRALERISAFRPGPWSVFGPLPDPWRIVGGPSPIPWGTTVSALDRLSWVALNPQPLPPRIVLALALAQEMIDRTSQVHELAEIFPEEYRSYAMDAAGSRLAQFVDDICGNDMRWWPFPVPPPQGDGQADMISADELVVMGAHFESAALVASERLQQDFARAGARLIGVGLERMPQR